MLISGETDF